MPKPSNVKCQSFPAITILNSIPLMPRRYSNKWLKQRYPIRPLHDLLPFQIILSGETTYWDWTLTPLLDDRGEAEFLVFSLEDVTERKRAEDAVEAERQRFNDVLEMLPAYLVLLTPDYHVPFANRFFRERFGESHGRRCFEYLFGRSEPCETCETYTVLKTMAPHQWEWTGPDGRNYDVFDFPFTDTDGSTLILEMGIDITERKRAEEALKAASLYTGVSLKQALTLLSPSARMGRSWM